LPFAIQGLRNFEVFPFILAYISAISLFKSKDKNYLKYIYLFFISIFFTFSKNAWITTIIITFITLAWEKKNLNIIKNCIFGTIIFALFIFTFQKLVIKKFHTNILAYSIFKILPDSPYIYKLFSNEYYDDFKKMFGIQGFERAEDHLSYLFNSSPTRILIYKQTVEEIFKNPLLGQGLNTHIQIKNTTGNNVYTDNYESQILTILIETGFVGFFIYLYIFIFSFIKIKQNKEFYITLNSGILILTIFNSYQRNIFIYFLLAFIFANIIKNSEIESFNNKSKK
jgi:O-antigen ligase